MSAPPKRRSLPSLSRTAWAASRRSKSNYVRAELGVRTPASGRANRRKTQGRSGHNRYRGHQGRQVLLARPSNVSISQTHATLYVALQVGATSRNIERGCALFSGAKGECVLSRIRRMTGQRA